MQCHETDRVVFQLFVLVVFLVASHQCCGFKEPVQRWFFVLLDVVRERFDELFQHSGASDLLAFVFVLPRDFVLVVDFLQQFFADAGHVIGLFLHLLTVAFN